MATTGTWVWAHFESTTDYVDIVTASCRWEGLNDAYTPAREVPVTFSKQQVNKTVQADKDQFVTDANAKVTAEILYQDMSAGEQTMLTALNA